MFDTVIEELFYDNEGFAGKIRPSEAFKEVSNKAYELYEKLRKVLNEEQKKILDEFADEEMGVTAEASFTHFKEGIKLGLRLCIECLLPTDN